MKKISFIMTLGVMLTLVACSQQVSVEENTKETTVNIQEQQKAQEAERKAIEESKAKALEESRKESIALEEAKKKEEETTTATKPVETKPAETKPTFEIETFPNNEVPNNPEPVTREGRQRGVRDLSDVEFDFKFGS